ncbi:hypothetical protein Droror1_Dr00018854 [Drosera rotundifolia]
MQAAVSATRILSQTRVREPLVLTEGDLVHIAVVLACAKRLVHLIAMYICTLYNGIDTNITLPSSYQPRSKREQLGYVLVKSIHSSQRSQISGFGWICFLFFVFSVK